jgi:hypothetical protein
VTSEPTHSAASNTRLKKILPIVIAIAALLLGALAIYAILVGPSKQPYRDALTQYQNVYNANVAFTNTGSAINASSASDDQFAKNIETLRASLASLETENEALAETEVLKTGEGKALYDTFNAKLTDYVAYNGKVITSIEVLRPVLYVCTEAMNSISQDAASARALRDCAADMEAIQDIPDEDYKKMTTSFIASYKGAANAIEQTIALNDPEGADQAAASRLEDELNGHVEDLSAASQTLTRDLQASRQEVDITESAIALDDYLKAKSSIF